MGLMLVLAAAWAPVSAMAQVYVCNSRITLETVGEEPFFINEAIPIVVTLEAQDVSDGTNDGLLFIESFDYKPDCEIGSDFETCTAAGNSVVLSTADVDIGGSCVDGLGYSFTVDDTDPNNWIFTPNTPVEFDPNESCTVEFDVTVQGVAGGNTSILEIGGWGEEQISCTSVEGEPYPDAAASASSGSLLFSLSTQRAQFRVTKDFVDDSAGEVEVFLRCNAGLPLEQSFMLGDEEFVTFVVREFQPGTMTCEVWEEPVPGGYSATYAATDDGGNGVAANVTADTDGCRFEGVQTGSFTCDVTNEVDAVSIVVNKRWIGVTANETFPLTATADYTCYDVYLSADGSGGLTNTSGTLSFDGLTDSETITGLYPAPSGSYCSVSEQDVPSFVEPDASDCASVPVEPGASCTLVNTVFFEGIPTLGAYGKALMALLMLGVGLVAFRRLV